MGDDCFILGSQFGDRVCQRFHVNYLKVAGDRNHGVLYLHIMWRIHKATSKTIIIGTIVLK